MDNHNAQTVGNAFVEQYYHVLHQSPELVHKFYQDISFLSRPGTDGTMTTVTTMQEIDDKILSLNYNDYTAEITTADAQDSYGKGVVVLVTGFLVGKDNARKKFTQTFFLAPQDKGYFVLNDVLRYVEDNEPSQLSSFLVNATDEQAPAAEPEATHSLESVPVHLEEQFEEEDQNNVAEVCDPSDNEGSVVEDEVQPSQIEVVPSIDAVPAVPEDAPKKSYASIVKVMKSNAGTTQIPVRAVKTTKSPDKESLNSAKPTPVEPLPTMTYGAPEANDAADEADGHSIYVRNLPFNATVAQLEEAFKTFGPIKADGIQVRSNKQGFTFGFVEFETSSSMRSALEASPITIGDRQAAIEEKRTTTKVGVSGRGRGRGQFRSDSFRGRSNFGGGGGRGYGRSEYRNQGEFSGRSRGSGGRSGASYQRVNQSGNGRAGHQGGEN